MADPFYIDANSTLYSLTGNTSEKTISSLQALSPIGSTDKALTNTFYGINHRQVPLAVQNAREMYGLTLFTRPALNLSTANIRGIRELIPLLNTTNNSAASYIRGLLDPSLMSTDTSFSCPILDNQQAFIPLLTNNLTSASGWPDKEVRTFISHEGIYGEVWGMIDSVYRNYSPYTITCNFRNPPGHPILALIDAWLLYASSVYLGDIVPYPDFWYYNEIDYNTRIYRLVLDSNKKRVLAIAATGAAHPTSAPFSQIFDFEADRPFNDGIRSISFNFQCYGAIYNDPILFDEFNRTSALFNSTMKNSNFVLSNTTTGTYTHSSMTQIPFAYLDFFNTRGYPRINPANRELEWWVDTTYYKAKLAGTVN